MRSKADLRLAGATLGVGAGMMMGFLGMAMPAAAQTPPIAQATRTSEGPRLDGVLDEDAWAAAIPITEFTQSDPEEGRPASESTIVRILYDDEALYVGAVLHDTRPVSTRLARRDDRVSASDWFSIALDSYRDFRTAYEFRVNPSGVRGDRTLIGDGGDDSWDPVWSVATRVTDGGWSLEMRIPFSQLRFRPAAEQLWGLQIQREIARRQEVSVFAFTPKSERAGIARYGLLSGLRGLLPGDRLELAPYLVGHASVAEVERNPDVGFADPFRDEREVGSRVGLDLKYRITSNFTLDATVNPDFGQIEADPAEVNLTAFESRFGERRPFFVEGNDIFAFGGGGWGGVNLFYTRRIGGPPPVSSVPGAAYADVPDATAILGAAKMTGRLQSGWAIGVLNAVTGAERARFVDVDGEIGAADVAPLANHLVARALRETNEGRTLFGGIVTAVNRGMDGGRLARAAREDAYAAGIDFRHEWADRSWAAHGYLIGSAIGGAPEVILAAQRSPARYYQRPDAGHLSIAPDATSLSGYAGRLQLSKQAGEHWRGCDDRDQQPGVRGERPRLSLRCGPDICRYAAGLRGERARRGVPPVEGERRPRRPMELRGRPAVGELEHQPGRAAHLVLGRERERAARDRDVRRPPHPRRPDGAPARGDPLFVRGRVRSTAAGVRRARGELRPRHGGRVGGLAERGG